MWAAGVYYNASPQRYQTLVVHFDGTAWTTVVSADPAAARAEIIGLAVSKTGSMITLVGRKGSSPLIEQAQCPMGPVSLPTRAPAPVPPAADRSGCRPRAEPAAKDAPGRRPRSR